MKWSDSKTNSPCLRQKEAKWSSHLSQKQKAKKNGQAIQLGKKQNGQAIQLSLLRVRVVQIESESSAD